MPAGCGHEGHGRSHGQGAPTLQVPVQDIVSVLPLVPRRERGPPALGVQPQPVGLAAGDPGGDPASSEPLWLLAWPGWAGSDLRQWPASPVASKVTAVQLQTVDQAGRRQQPQRAAAKADPLHQAATRCAPGPWAALPGLRAGKEGRGLWRRLGETGSASCWASWYHRDPLNLGDGIHKTG